MIDDGFFQWLCVWKMKCVPDGVGRVTDQLVDSRQLVVLGDLVDLTELPRLPGLLRVWIILSHLPPLPLTSVLW